MIGLENTNAFGDQKQNRSLFCYSVCCCCFFVCLFCFCFISFEKQEGKRNIFAHAQRADKAVLFGGIFEMYVHVCVHQCI